MGIHCEINLHKPVDGVFRPGSIVTGAVKYAVDKETLFQKITVSLMGKGLVHARKPAVNQYDFERNYYNGEEYAHAENVITGDEKGITVPIGLYEVQFRFELPQNIPPSLNYSHKIGRYIVKCKIAYYILMKFERPGFMKLNKYYNKEIEVVSGITPKLPTAPCVHSEKKTLTQLLTKSNSVNLKATIENSVITPIEGGKINFNYELFNDTNITVNNVSIKLYEVYTFYIKDNWKLEHATALKDTDSKTGAIKKRESQNMEMEIAVPSNVLGGLEFSNIVSREYRVGIKVKLPVPHRNMVMYIPVQIGKLNDTNFTANEEVESPPSYWEAMAEDNDVYDVKEEKNSK